MVFAGYRSAAIPRRSRFESRDMRHTNTASHVLTFALLAVVLITTACLIAHSGTSLYA